ncbi:MAG: GNAT family N-acetyltransferase [Chloroflexota bacterium]|nr:GNAT family protein [Anaerolineales bacterium]
MKDVLKGEFVRLSAFDPEEMSKAFARWDRNSEYFRLLNSSTVQMKSAKSNLKWMEEEVAEMSPSSYYFSIRTLAEDKLLGELGLDVVNWVGREAFVGLGIGETEHWSKGYGTDIMNVLLRYAFTELNLKRVSLSVFEYNPRAIRSYEKAGFRHEGQLRNVLNREGRRWNIVYMGSLREEWMEQNGY